MNVLSNKRVAGTIMLNLHDGTKKFLIHPVGKTSEFVTTEVLEDMTGLASILQHFKKNIQLDVTSISLVELTNAHSETEDLPLFVFEMEESKADLIKNDTYRWESPSKLKALLSVYDMAGMPMF
ncbi:hypothetical protein LI951_05430 [Enterococcus sp. BWT-B8]|uniref:hypothetical protein n=1 Tax=unclassified Enterococcus TaxID=2608891 RepID=UPI001E528D29|nr:MULTISPECIES: hypothetical protein [unclassified Enterococcus]MCB5951500.1 hypothetical protein [Enterococcus sp. BWT-B8]MCB5956426.1 hypothetical protein [Enterococcus sp. CWB-B31]